MKVSNKWNHFEPRRYCESETLPQVMKNYLRLSLPHMWFRGRTKIRGENLNKEVSSPISWHSLTGFCTWQGGFFFFFFFLQLRFGCVCAVSLCHSLSSGLTVFSSDSPTRRRWNWKLSIKRIKAGEKRQEMETSLWRWRLKVGIWPGHTGRAERAQWMQKVAKYVSTFVCVFT